MSRLRCLGSKWKLIVRHLVISTCDFVVPMSPPLIQIQPRSRGSYTTRRACLAAAVAMVALLHHPNKPTSIVIEEQFRPPINNVCIGALPFDTANSIQNLT